MSKLELKIVPPAVVLIFAVLMWLISQITPQIDFLGNFRILIPGIFIAAGVLLMLVSASAFRKVKTTINPMRPENSSALVTSGVYRFSRNPIYVADLLILLGWGFYLSNPYALVLIAVFVLYETRFQIMPEERALQTRFGDQYLDYTARVRRWI